MKTFVCLNFSGVYLPGQAVVIAENTADASLLLMDRLMCAGFRHDQRPKEWKWVEMNTKKPGVLLTFDGNH